MKPIKPKTLDIIWGAALYIPLIKGTSRGMRLSYYQTHVTINLACNGFAELLQIFAKLMRVWTELVQESSVFYPETARIGLA